MCSHLLGSILAANTNTQHWYVNFYTIYFNQYLPTNIYIFKTYKYGSIVWSLQVISHSDADLEGQPSQPKALQLSSNPFPSSLPQNRRVDPSPIDSWSVHFSDVF